MITTLVDIASYGRIPERVRWCAMLAAAFLILRNRR